MLYMSAELTEPLNLNSFYAYGCAYLLYSRGREPIAHLMPLLGSLACGKILHDMSSDSTA